MPYHLHAQADLLFFPDRRILRGILSRASCRIRSAVQTQFCRERASVPDQPFILLELCLRIGSEWLRLRHLVPGSTIVDLGYRFGPVIQCFPIPRRRRATPCLRHNAWRRHSDSLVRALSSGDTLLGFDPGEKLSALNIY